MGTDPTIANKIKGSKGPPEFIPPIYTLYTSTRLKPQALTRDHETRRI